MGQHFTFAMEPLVVWIVSWFKFLKGVWEGYSLGHARSSNGSRPGILLNSPGRDSMSEIGLVQAAMKQVDKISKSNA